MFLAGTETGKNFSDSPSTRGSYYHKSCTTICVRDQNEIKRSRLPFVVNQTIKKVLNWAIKHLTKVTCKHNDNLQGFPGFPVSASSDQDVLKTKSSDQATLLILIAVADGSTGLMVVTTPCSRLTYQ